MKRFKRARYYDPGTGRFLQVDPDAGSLSNPSTFYSKYSYVSNNPINMVDPLGLRGFFDNVGAQIANVVDFSFSRMSENLGRAGIHIPPAQMMRTALIAAAIAGVVVGFSTGNPHLTAASAAVGYRNVMDFNNNDESASSILWKSTKIAGAAVIGAEVGLLVGGLGGAILVPIVTSAAARQFGLSKRESVDAGAMASIGFLGGTLKDGGIGGGGSSAGQNVDWAGGRLVPR